MLRPRRCRSCFRDRCSQLISACLPKLAARVGLAPTPCGLTNRRATLTPPGNGAAGRILTCIVPLRRRMPDIFDHGSKLKLVSAAGVAPAITRSQAECVATTLRADAPSDFKERWSGESFCPATPGSTLRLRVAMRCGFWNGIPISNPAS